MRVPIILHALRHDLWATEQLIAFCRTLTPDQLELTAPGTYGSVAGTLSHILRGDERYLVRLGVMPGPMPSNDDVIPLDQLGAHLETVRAAVEGIFRAEQFDPDKVVVDAARRRPTDPPLEIESWTMLVQFVHHGSDHRAHIGTILGSHGLTGPNLDVWAYGYETGAIRAKR
jgi:uncharacterized damage-inducible protein DinB